MFFDIRRKEKERHEEFLRIKEELYRLKKKEIEREKNKMFKNINKDSFLLMDPMNIKTYKAYMHLAIALETILNISEESEEKQYDPIYESQLRAIKSLMNTLYNDTIENHKALLKINDDMINNGIIKRKLTNEKKGISYGFEDKVLVIEVPKELEDYRRLIYETELRYKYKIYDKMTDQDLNKEE